MEWIDTSGSWNDSWSGYSSDTEVAEGDDGRKHGKQEIKGKERESWRQP